MSLQKISLFILLLMIGFTSKAQLKHLETIPQTQELSVEIATLFQENKIGEAIGTLEPYWPLPISETEDLKEKTIKYINILRQRFGKPIGIVKVNNETIADIAIRETYLVRYEYTSIRLIFTYYKNNNGWIVNGFKWDDSFSKEFK